MQLELSDGGAGADHLHLDPSMGAPEGVVHAADDDSIRIFPSHTCEARETTTSHPKR
ncbi:MAG TPA: hypothetical protein VGZ33_01065 [Acidimicrobiales bacterium]|nr:hypothetical protein [Acidimicrobiales bacterium]